MIDNRNQINDNKFNKAAGSSGIRQVAIRKVDTMEQNKTIHIKLAEVKETELDQVSGGIENVPQNELYSNGNEIDLFNPDFLFEKNETVT